jgi:hypothetical protein
MSGRSARCCTLRSQQGACRWLVLPPVRCCCCAAPPPATRSPSCNLYDSVACRVCAASLCASPRQRRHLARVSRAPEPRDPRLPRLLHAPQPFAGASRQGIDALHEAALIEIYHHGARSLQARDASDPQPPTALHLCGAWQRSAAEFAALAEQPASGGMRARAAPARATALPPWSLLALAVLACGTGSIRCQTPPLSPGYMWTVYPDSPIAPATSPPIVVFADYSPPPPSQTSPPMNPLSPPSFDPVASSPKLSPPPEPAPALPQPSPPPGLQGKSLGAFG